LPVKQVTIARTPNGTDTTEMEYSDWRVVDGMRLPFRHTQRRNGVVVERFEMESLVVNVPLAEGEFAEPAGFVSQPVATPLAPTLTTLGEDVYLVERGGYNSLFVVFDDYVLLVEPVLGGPASLATQRLIAQTAPGKPIRTVIATHFHADHIGGAPVFLDGGSSIVTTPHAADAIRRVLARVGGTAARAAQVDTVTSRRSFNDARHSVDVYAVGPTPHAEQMLVVYLPKERLLFESDLLDIDAAPGRAQMAGHDTETLRQRVRELGLSITTIVPAHGHVGTFADLESARRPKIPGR
jgi:glyoxylase-like metal-dependent hydrolase (beta-lactamase superfamily II)